MYAPPSNRLDHYTYRAPGIRSRGRNDGFLKKSRLSGSRAGIKELLPKENIQAARHI